MHRSLRRSCAACARSKHRCDLGVPRCSRCKKRNVQCVYANQPLGSAPARSGKSALSGPLTGQQLASFDPFDSYPPTRLPREQVQRLIHSFLHKIAFQYYPLDLCATTNPFLVSWWPLALGDPALFHVSLQTACLDEERMAQRGFHTSDILMADSVALLRRKVQDTSLAAQDGTMNAVITLATIEFGKGNIEIAEMHVDGVKKLVELRGGIGLVRQTSPLTARMVSWVSMLIMGHPQFETQDDAGMGHGIPLPLEWQLASDASDDEVPCLDRDDVGPEVWSVLARLRSIFHRAQHTPFPATLLHDLTCFVIHRLLLSAPDSDDDEASPLTEALRYAIISYMFLTQGPTYFSHMAIFQKVVSHLARHLQRLESSFRPHDELRLWLLAVAMVATAGTENYPHIVEQARLTAAWLQLHNSADALCRVKSILWLETPCGEAILQPHWDAVLGAARHPEPPDLTDAAASTSRTCLI